MLYRLQNSGLFSLFTEDIIVDGVGILSLPPEDLKTPELNADKHSLYFDDAYQYTVAEKYEMQLVSFDTDLIEPIVNEWNPSRYCINIHK